MLTLTQPQPHDVLTPHDADRLLGYPRGRSSRLARKGLLPHVVLPDGELRFLRAALIEWLERQQTIPGKPAKGGER